MIGHLTEDELISMGNIISDVNSFKKGYVCRVVSNTVNHYKKESDDSWTNYKCNTRRN
jgi:hypothetical protein